MALHIRVVMRRIQERRCLLRVRQRMGDQWHIQQVKIRRPPQRQERQLSKQECLHIIFVLENEIKFKLNLKNIFAGIRASTLRGTSFKLESLFKFHDHPFVIQT